MNDPLLFWQERNDATDERLRTFERKFFIVKKVVKEVEPQTESADNKAQEVVYGRVSSKFTRNQLFKNVIDKEIPTPEPGDIQRKLYGK